MFQMSALVLPRLWLGCGVTWERAMEALGVGVLALILVVLSPSASRVDVGPQAVAGATPPRGFNGRPGVLSVQAEGVISTTIGSADGRFVATPSPSGWRVHGGELQAVASRRGMALAVPGAGSVSLSLATVGRSTRSVAPVLRALTACRNQVTYDYGAVEESFAAGPPGIEQTFTIGHRPGGRGSLSVALALGGSLRATATDHDVRFVTASSRAALESEPTPTPTALRTPKTPGKPRL